MLKSLRREPWICARCLRQQQLFTQRRTLVGVATAQKHDIPPVVLDTNSAKEDDNTLRQIFDSQSFWKSFSSQKRTQQGTPLKGLLQNRYLTSPQGFQQFTQDALQKCQRIVRRILDTSSTEQYKDIVRQLDRLSDQLCRVIDLVDFIRNVHPSPAIQQAAAVAHAQMYEYMNLLNTTKGLESQLQRASDIPEVAKSWSEEEQVTARILLADFAQSAIDGSDSAKQRFVELTSGIAQIGQELVENMAPAEAYVHVPSNKLKGMDPTVVKRVTRLGTASLPVLGYEARHALSTVHDPEVRKQIYIATRQASADSVERVEQLIQTRAELARLANYNSFAEMTLGDKMAKTPDAVMQFLRALAKDNKQRIDGDLAEMAALKSKIDGWQINAWDRAYYGTQLRQREQAAIAARPSDLLASYFSLGSVMQGLSRLFSRLYGIRLVPRETAPGETWDDDVRRLDVVDEKEGHIAVIYCDLFSRPNKSPNPAHFTLRCSRTIGADEIAEAASTGTLQTDSTPSSQNLSAYSHALNDGMSLSLNPRTGTLSQTPTIAFICDFPRPSTSSSSAPPTLLSLRQVTTLYHEMGHCLHSIIGRTSLQNVAGTRCATDFAELPSILMEHFATSPDVLALYANHWQTGRALDPALVTAELAAARRYISASETETQILLSVLDQTLHGRGVTAAVAAGQRFDSTAAYERTWADPAFSATPEPSGVGATWHGFFGHLFQYGAVYYSYLFDRAIAGKIWRDVFAETTGSGLFGGANPTRSRLSRDQGQRYRDEVLRWGGARSGWACVAGVLGQRRYGWMAEGGAAAMEEVGKWGAGEADD